MTNFTEVALAFLLTDEVWEREKTAILPNLQSLKEDDREWTIANLKHNFLYGANQMPVEGTPASRC